MPNVKAGDLAITKYDGPYSGLLVDVLYQAPEGVDFTMPNGIVHEPIQSPPGWVVKLIGWQFPAKMGPLARRKVDMGVISDRYLYPLPGGSVEDELVTAHHISGEQQP